MPISRVRSETVASMMFMIPIPPTRSEMLAIEPSTRLKIRCVAAAFSSSSSGTVIDVVFLGVELAEQAVERVRRSS